MGSTLPTLCPNRDKNWKWHFPFRSGPHQPTLPNGKNEKMKNDLRVLKQILYNMGHMIVARWIFQKAWKFKPPL